MPTVEYVTQENASERLDREIKKLMQEYAWTYREALDHIIASDKAEFVSLKQDYVRG
jgi:hypothetical protein